MNFTIHTTLSGKVLSYVMKPDANVIKPFTPVINCHFKVVLSFCVIKLNYIGNYCAMAVNYHGICVTNVLKHNLN
jgi:hypothetical protein